MMFFYNECEAVHVEYSICSRGSGMSKEADEDMWRATGELWNSCNVETYQCWLYSIFHRVRVHKTTASHYLLVATMSPSFNELVRLNCQFIDLTSPISCVNRVAVAVVRAVQVFFMVKT